MQDDENHLKLIESLFLKMGAPEKQAHTMASQLLKRAGQVAEEREITQVEAVQTLLKQIIEAQKD